MTAGARHVGRRAVIVAVSGLDGAGKSSQVRLLETALRERGIDAAREWVPVAYDASIERAKRRANAVLRALRLRPTLAPPRESALPRPDTELTPGKALVRKSTVARQLWMTFIALTNVVSHWRSLLRHGSGSVVIFDRYTLDSAVRLDAWYSDLGSVGVQSWLVRTLSPRPFRAYLLDVDPEIAYARRPGQWEVDELRRQAALYRANAAKYRVRRLDGERPVAELAAEIAADVHAGLTARR